MDKKIVDLDDFRNKPPPQADPANDTDGAQASSSAGTLPGDSQGVIYGSVDDLITRQELNDKLALAEARTETRFVQLDAKLDKLTSALTDKGGLIDQLGDLRTQVKSEANTTRWTIAGIFIATMVGALAALWTTQANLLSAFQAALAVHH